MTIKQLEQELEIPRATIRFYEKENLINPKRKDNSYREYDEKDIAILKKVIILRKIGLSVADIKKVLSGECSLQILLEKNIIELEKQIKELEGAINITKIMKDKNEDILSLDENMYWKEIDELQKSGLKFKEIVNDIVKFEKGVFLKEFLLVNDEGKIIYDLKKSIFTVFELCTITGLVWYLFEGKDRNIRIFLKGFFWPFICILITSILGLPIYFIEKKNKKLALKIKKIGKVLAITITVVIIILMIQYYFTL